MSWSDALPACVPDARRRAWLRGLGAAVLLPLLLGGCGFHLRGSTRLAYDTLVVQGQQGPLLNLLRRDIVAVTGSRIVTDPKQAQAVLTLLQESTSQTPTAYNADGTVAQYELRDTARFELTAPDGAVLIGPTTITRSSRMSYSTAATLAKASEADLLYAGMRQSLVNRMLFQLGNFRPPAAAAPAR